MIVTNEELDKVLTMISDCEVSPRWALHRLDYYFDQDLYMEFVDLQNHHDIHKQSLRDCLDKCEILRKEGYFKKYEDYSFVSDPYVRKCLEEEGGRIRAIKIETRDDILTQVANSEISPKYALWKLGYYYDHDLDIELGILPNHKDIYDPTLRHVLKLCEERKLNGKYDAYKSKSGT